MKKFIKTMTISLMLVFALTIVACQGETPAAEQEAIALEIENTIPAVTKTTQPPTPSPTSIKTSQELALTHVALGDAYIKDEAWNLAIDEYSLALELDVQAETCFKRGEAYRFLGDHELALEDYQQVVALDPQYAAAYLKQGEIYMMSAGYDDAIAMFEEVITLETADAAVYHQLGIAYFNRDQFDLALEAYNEALTLNTENASYYLSRADLYIAQEDYQSAITDYDQAIALEPELVTAYIKRGEAHLQNIYTPLELEGVDSEDETTLITIQEGDHNQAIADFSKALELDPNCIEAYLLRANTYAKYGDQELAIADYSEVINLDPQQLDAIVQRGELYFDDEEMELALADFNAALAINPDHIDALVGRGFVYLYEQNFDKIPTDANHIIALDDQNGYGHFLRALVYFNSEDYRLAADELELASELIVSNEDFDRFDRDLLALIQNLWSLAIRRGAPKYTIEMPSGTGWVKEETEDYLLFTNQSTDQYTEIYTKLNWVQTDKERMNVQSVANDYRQNEVDNILWEAESEGAFELIDVVTGTIRVNDKEFYYLTYSEVYDENIVGEPYRADGQLYIYFPDDFVESRIFYMILITDVYIEGNTHIPFADSDVEALLTSFELNAQTE